MKNILQPVFILAVAAHRATVDQTGGASLECIGSLVCRLFVSGKELGSTESAIWFAGCNAAEVLRSTG
jgi:hypothetical protein